MIIYKATNLINGKIYIGMTTKDLEHRVKIHKRVYMSSEKLTRLQSNF